MPELPRVVGYPFWVRRREPHPFGKGKRMDKGSPLSVVCPDCGAPVGEPCRWAVLDPHRSRKRLAT